MDHNAEDPKNLLLPPWSVRRILAALPGRRGHHFPLPPGRSAQRVGLLLGSVPLRVTSRAHVPSALLLQPLAQDRGGPRHGRTRSAPPTSQIPVAPSLHLLDLGIAQWGQPTRHPDGLVRHRNPTEILPSRGEKQRTRTGKNDYD